MGEDYVDRLRRMEGSRGCRETEESGMEKRMENECGEWMGEDNVEGLRRVDGRR